MIVDELKISILEQAIRGKLVKNNNDLEIIDSELERYYKKYNGKVEKKLSPDFEIPLSWRWVRLDNITYSNIGLTYKPSNVNNTGTIVLRSNNIKDGKLYEDDFVHVDISVPENKMCHPGDILMCSRNGSKRLVGKCAIIDKEGYSFGAFMAIIRSEIPDYLYYMFNSDYFRKKMLGDASTTTINQITQKMLANFWIPVPPMEEQERIVQKIEEIFSHLDDIKSLEEKISSIKKNFPREMKKSILFSAISGKLSVQNNNDTPVDNQLEKIKRESEQFYLINKIKNSHRKNHDYKFFTDDTYVIPATWKYVPLSSTCLSIFSGKSPKYVKYNNDNLILGQKVNQEDGLHFENLKYGTDEFIKSLPKYQFLIKNDVLLNTLGGGSVGRCGIFDNDIPNITTDGHIFVIRTAGFTNEKYIMYFLRLYKEKLEEYANGTTNQKFFNIKQIEDIMIPLPPIEEQKRIVDKIEQLLPLCNDIEKLIKS